MKKLITIALSLVTLCFCGCATDAARSTVQTGSATASSVQTAYTNPGNPMYEPLLQEWHDECKAVSWSSDSKSYISLPAFRKIVALGQSAVPDIEERLRSTPEDFMLAYAITDINGWKRADFATASDQEFRDMVLARLDERKKEAHQP